MRVVRSLAELGVRTPSAVTVGNFDGVHRGHQKILATTRDSAESHGIRSLALTFEPHPLSCIAPDRAPTPISTLEQKLRLIEDFGIDVVFVQKFTKDFSRISARAFITTYLLDAFQTRILCVGHNFRFGHGHRGDLETLRQSKADFEVLEVPAVILGGEAVSSSRIRHKIVSGHVREVRRMLGRSYQMDGVVVSGQGRGRRVTVPTLNLNLDNSLVPADGVYLTCIAGDSGPFMESVTNVGVRPTFGAGERTVETHLLEGNPPTDSLRVRLRFVERLREERKFSDAAALRSQINRDLEAARRFFRRLDSVRAHVAEAGAQQDAC